MNALERSDCGSCSEKKLNMENEWETCLLKRFETFGVFRSDENFQPH